jgi:hypothetical protein
VLWGVKRYAPPVFWAGMRVATKVMDRLAQSGRVTDRTRQMERS